MKTLPAVQSGATLLVAMMLLLAMTIMGLTAVRVTTQQQRMAANSQFQNLAFQAADAAIRKVMAEVRGQAPVPAYLPGGTNLLVDTFSGPRLRCAPDPGSAPTACTANTQTGLISSATVSYAGQFETPGFSMNVSNRGFVGHRFRIDAMGQVSGTTAVSLQEQGMERIGPRQ